jgi:hypothetical protein
MERAVDHFSRLLPEQLPVGASYVVEGYGGESGNLRVISRYVLMPDGSCINVPAAFYEAHIRPMFASQDAVVARSFGPPGVVAECAAAFLRVGGQLVVSEPPEGTVPTERWPQDGLALLGLQRDQLGPGARYASCTQITTCPERYPRRSVKQPLF